MDMRRGAGRARAWAAILVEFISRAFADAAGATGAMPQPQSSAPRPMPGQPPAPVGVTRRTFGPRCGRAQRQKSMQSVQFRIGPLANFPARTDSQA